MFTGFKMLSASAAWFSCRYDWKIGRFSLKESSTILKTSGSLGGLGFSGDVGVLCDVGPNGVRRVRALPVADAF